MNCNIESEFSDYLIENDHSFDINTGLKILHTASQNINLSEESFFEPLARFWGGRLLREYRAYIKRTNPPCLQNGEQLNERLTKRIMKQSIGCIIGACQCAQSTYLSINEKSHLTIACVNNQLVPSMNNIVPRILAHLEVQHLQFARTRYRDG